MSIGWPEPFPDDIPVEFTLPNGAFYVPERDGTILEYLSKMEKERTPRAFRTFKHFQMLVDN